MSAYNMKWSLSVCQQNNDYLKNFRFFLSLFLFFPVCSFIRIAYTNDRFELTTCILINERYFEFPDNLIDLYWNVNRFLVFLSSFCRQNLRISDFLQSLFPIKKKKIPIPTNTFQSGLFHAVTMIAIINGIQMRKKYIFPLPTMCVIWKHRDYKFIPFIKWS